MNQWGCVGSMYMGCAMDGGLWVLTILMEDRESLAGIGLEQRVLLCD